MAILTSTAFAELVAAGGCSPLNAMWLGRVTRPFLLPQLPRLLQARQLIEARCLDELKVADVATVVSLSEFHFARLFAAAFGESLYQFIKRLRLDEARHRLLTNDISVSELGLQVGYGSLSSFIYAFRRRFGLSPAQYREQLQNEQE
jgi:AraC family transcriptional regulator